jgi:hypothetical protein
MTVTQTIRDSYDEIAQDKTERPFAGFVVHSVYSDYMEIIDIKAMK